LDFVFTDGHAVDRFSAQYTIDDIENIESIIDWPAIQTKYWKDETDLDLKRRKEAEFLVLGGIPIEAILGYIVYNNIAYGKLIEFGISQEKVIVKPDYYF
jgi:DNA topoisomerase VI subunit A